jgi:hypothetical protein
VADFNGDGIPDLAVANFGGLNLGSQGTVSILLGNADLVVPFGGGVRVLLGNGDGTFQTALISSVAGNGPTAIAVGDFNGDGLPDLAVADFANSVVKGGVSILINDGKRGP